MERERGGCDSFGSVTQRDSGSHQASPPTAFTILPSLDFWGWLSDWGKYSTSNKSNCLSRARSAFILGHFLVLSEVRLVFKYPSLDNQSSAKGVVVGFCFVLFFSFDECQDQKQLSSLSCGYRPIVSPSAAEGLAVIQGRLGIKEDSEQEAWRLHAAWGPRVSLCRRIIDPKWWGAHKFIPPTTPPPFLTSGGDLH